MNSLFSKDDKEIIRMLKSLKFPNDVAELLEIRYKFLNYILYIGGMARQYNIFTIKKKSGGERTIYSPKVSLKIIQRKIRYILDLIYKPKSCVHGFTTTKNTVTNAALHVNKKYVFNVDLKDFFPSINFGRIRGMFMKKPYNLPDKVATILAQICCYENLLPQGSPTSPILSNMICAKMDSELQRLAKKYKIFYTRYADDLTFSFDRKLPRDIVKMIDDDEGNIQIEIGYKLRKIIENNGFTINESKIRLQRRTQQQLVTGIVVNNKLNVRRKFIRQIRAMLHAWATYGLENAEQEFHTQYLFRHKRNKNKKPSFQKVLSGKLGYLQMVRGCNDPLYLKLQSKYNELVGHDSLPIIITSREQIEKATWVLECEQDLKQGTAFMLEGIGLVTCAHVIGSNTRAFQITDISKKYSTTIVYICHAIDLAILKINDFDHRFCLRPNFQEQCKNDDIIFAVGFPNYNYGDTLYSSEGKIAGFRTKSTVRRMLATCDIIEGMSGGPVFNQYIQVVGISVTGADRAGNTGNTEDKAVIPISTLQLLTAQTDEVEQIAGTSSQPRG